MDAMGMMRDLDQIREREEGGSPRVVVMALGGLATACVLFAAGVLIGRDGEHGQARRREDPLQRLDALAGQVARSEAPATTFAERLSPSATAGATAAAGATTDAGAAPVADPAALTPRPDLALPSGSVVETLGIGAPVPAVATLAPAAPNQGRGQPQAPAANGPAAAVGSEGAFTLQVSSFRSVAPAQSLAQRLRERGYHAYVAPAAPVSRGPNAGPPIQWHRVRIGPFSNLGAANQFRQTFESRERMPTFVVRRDDPRMRQGE